MTDKERKSNCEQNQNQKIIDAQCKDKIKTEDSVPHDQNAVAQDRDAQKKLTFRIVDSPMGIGKSSSLMTQVRFNVAYGDDDQKHGLGNGMTLYRNGRPGNRRTS